MPDLSVQVNWQIARDPGFADVVRAGAAALPELGHSVHVEVAGLEPGRHYWYRFRAGQYVSPAGRTKTALHSARLRSHLSAARISRPATQLGRQLGGGQGTGPGPGRIPAAARSRVPGLLRVHAAADLTEASRAGPAAVPPGCFR
ncbi:PhoD-like phosphatase N-terminal domain-containing protein [Pseudarthrobacter sp. MDT3-28]|uniref:PhoD-like phosphatase N-terminal domain-containing protein n=1 Tax=Pseudarthrobacter raffinosi TaxID=2953651 RepID=UPI00208DFC47|nr:PhoD-like phosphatase N-terminal domain-containing protein [Pseudarthrobacter sp. MDT3-28]MCO4238645.1 PhoD-like phosphatase N-terminal domain-containing protein [Pseudarthrobacter sp. MDT3-28]